MATLAFAVAGAAAGSALLPSGLTVLGATIGGAALGSQIGAMAGSYVDQALFGGAGTPRVAHGPRLKDLHVTSSTEGAAIARIYGRARLGGQIIWADKIIEKVTKKSADGAGKGASAGGGATASIEYRYYASFAVALCEGPVTVIERMWADGTEISRGDLACRFYPGSETQTPDSLIAAVLGTAHAPAFRGTAYIVFERLPLAPYGNRIPQLSFEVARHLDPLNAMIKGVVIIPGSGEFVVSPQAVTRTVGFGVNEPENSHTQQGVSDWTASLDQLQITLPNATSASLVVSWFGTDLRAGECRLHPGVDRVSKTTKPLTWSVSGRTRADAYVVSQIDGRASFGGTPSDQTVVAAIKDLKARGIAVTMSPFILMDVPPGNAWPDPYSASPAQPVYPWRGRITCHPAPGRPGTPDKTAAAAAQIASFVGTVTPAQFAVSAETVTYTGPNEWSLRRMVLHMAALAKAAGGVEAFVLGSELRGLTQVRSGAGTFPFVAALQALAADVKTMLGPATKVLYAADWSEYFGYQPADGSGDVYFHLDPLWASPSIDAIGIDVYWPLADWRDGVAHLDYQAGARSIYDRAYLRSNLQGGEGYAWYYASAADRQSQTRTAISDGAGKPWVFRYKDIKNWWLNQHFNRPGGVESATPTAWVAQSKPFWLMEIGCPAVDKGANQPNVFIDPKSSESTVPHFSNGARDDDMQRRFLRAFIEGIEPASPGYVAGLNPVSSVYGARMIETARVHTYAWDARPYPAFPFNPDLWSDAGNWQLGHWLNGRMASAPLDSLVSTMLTEYGFESYDATALVGTVPGYVIDRPMAPRDALQPLELAYFFDALESGGKIVMRHRGVSPPVLDLTPEALVETKPDRPLMSITRGQETDLPASAKLSFIRSEGDYSQTVVEARRLTGASGRLAQAELPIVMEPARAAAVVESWLHETWAARERMSLTLPPSCVSVEPGDILRLTQDGMTRLVRIKEISDSGPREIEARAIDPDVYRLVSVAPRPVPTSPPPVTGTPLVEVLDLPLLRGDEQPAAGYVAVAQEPWPGDIAIYSSPETTGFMLRGVASFPSVIGETLQPFPPGPTAVIDTGTRVRVTISQGELVSATPLQVFAGANAAAIRNPQGQWEVFQYLTAALVGTRTYELSGLLRGQAGTETAMTATLPAGTRIVFLSDALAPVDITLAEMRLPLNWRIGPLAAAIDDDRYISLAHAFRGLGLRPYAPVHVRAVRAGGDITISWKRRTRIGGDSWAEGDVPLSEESERYEIDVLLGASVKRTLNSTVTSVAYTAADQTADFGALQPSVSIAVYQMSATYGRGAAALASI